MNNKNELVYHYTSIENAISIIDNRQLWMTELCYLNDRNEIQLGLDLITAVIDKTYNEGDDTNPVNSCLFYIKLQLILSFSNENKKRQEVMETAKKSNFKINDNWNDLYNNKIDVFIICFSEHKDNLRQWLPYASDGKGLALGFEKQSLRTFFNNRPELALDPLIEVIYDVTDMEEKCKQILKELIDSLQKIQNENDLYEEFNDKILVEIMKKLIILMISFKSEDYKDEKE